MNDSKNDKTLNAYPRAWRRSHGDALSGMLDESAVARPERTKRETLITSQAGLAVRSRWVLPYVLGIAAVIGTVSAVAIVSIDFTESNAVLVQSLLFSAVPLLSLWSFVTAVSASLKVPGIPWTAAVVGSIGVLLAGGAHLAWYAGVDAVFDGAASLWLFLFVLALVPIATVFMQLTWPAFSRSMFAPFAGLLTTLVGTIGAAASIGAFATPATAPVLSLAALVSVIIFHRRSLHQRADRVRAATLANS